MNTTHLTPARIAARAVIRRDWYRNALDGYRSWVFELIATHQIEALGDQHVDTIRRMTADCMDAETACRELDQLAYEWARAQP